ncbi:molybdopterin biosynthesis protein [Bacillus shivajii]|uniref:molybdopterin biosynthesis protein n=1 Tax=Bacillus shivajii TaxID=1983719 RepID=UPI001CF9D9C3|nr:molybdopterin biosynthesis protein [Bacillus shivajii]UCZ52387.1 molybdopterin biosynthesis protein [Bacillus shivajii]
MGGAVEQMGYERTIYLEDKPRKVAQQECLHLAEFKRKTETISVTEAGGRVTAKPIYAHMSNPHFHASAMDGIAVLAEKTEDAHESNPIHLKEGTDFVYVDTGNVIPHGYNAVIMIEDVNEVEPGILEIVAPATPWQRIRPIGEDITYGEMLLPQGHTIRPVDIGALLASGQTTVSVVKKPVVHILPSGNELVSPGEPIKPGNIIEFNGSIFSEFVKEWGGEPQLQPIVQDNPEDIRKALIKSTEEADIVVINAGSSAGSKDYTVHIMRELGEVITHGIATRPGKPMSVGKINGTIVVGVPGYPVSACLTLEWFVQPLVCDYLQTPIKKRETIKVKAGRRIVSNMGSEDFVRVHIGKVDGEYVANPLTRSASVTMSLVKADGLLVIPAEHLGVEQGEEVEVELYKSLPEIDSATLFSGSHDLCIDVLSSMLKEQDATAQITASHTGSMAGLMAIKRKEAHMAGVHLLDPETGVYNISYLERFLHGEDVVLLPFLKREQGLIVPKGNPLNIQGVRCLAEKNSVYVNRQRGAGTRILFDHLLNDQGIEPDEITGYDREMFTHLSVAAEVRMSERNVGMGIYSASKAMDLDFIPIGDESYDLVMRTSFLESEQGQNLLNVIKSEVFKQNVERLGGYKVQENIEPYYLAKV